MGLLATAPLVTGLLGYYGVYDPIYALDPLPENVLLDSNLRLLNGFSVATGLAIYYIIPKIDLKTELFRTICGIIFMGAVGRVISIYNLGFPPFPMPFFIVIEIFAPPVLIFWQNKVRDCS